MASRVIGSGTTYDKFIDSETDKILTWKYHMDEFTIIYKEKTYNVLPDTITGIPFTGDR